MLLDKVYTEGLSVYKAAKVLKLNYQNAKAIVRKVKLQKSPSDSEDEYEEVEELPYEEMSTEQLLKVRQYIHYFCCIVVICARQTS